LFLFTLHTTTGQIQSEEKTDPTPVITHSEPSHAYFKLDEEQVIPFMFSENTEDDKLYTYQFMIQPQWEGRQLFLRLHGIQSAYLVKINGFNYGSVNGKGYPVEFNITPFLREDMNRVELVMDGKADPFGFMVDDPGSLIIRDPVHIRDFRISTFPGSDPSETGVRIHLHIQSYLTGKNEGRNITLLLKDPEDKTLTTRTAELNHPLAFKQETEITFDLILTEPFLWSPHQPDLYRIELHVAERGRIQGERIYSEFGIRNAVYNDSLFIMNGDTLIPKIADHSLFTGMLNSPNEMFDLIREKGYNAIEAGCYLPPRIIEMCDRKGVLVIQRDEIISASQDRIYADRPSVVKMK